MRCIPASQCVATGIDTVSQMKHWHSVRDYEILRAMIATGTTVAASHRLAVSQSTVSRALSTLEERLGYTLFTRDANRLQPTAEALRLNTSLDSLFNVLSDIEGRIRPEPEGSLRVASTTTLAHVLLQPMVVSFLRQGGMGTMSLDVGSTDMLLDGVADERFDICISDRDIQRAGIRVTPLCRSHIACAIPAGHNLASKTEIRPDDLARTDFVAASKRLPLRHATDQIFRSAGVEPNVVVETSCLLTRLEFVRKGIGLTLINPFPVAAGLPEGVVLRPFRPALVFRTSFWTATGKALDARARAFIQHVKFFAPRDSWSEAI